MTLSEPDKLRRVLIRSISLPEVLKLYLTFLLCCSASGQSGADRFSAIAHLLPIRVFLERVPTIIAAEAFKGCSSMISITLPDTLTTIGKEAFRNCSSLTSIMLPDSLTTIEDQAFLGCFSLASITLPDSLTSMGSPDSTHTKSSPGAPALPARDSLFPCPGASSLGRRIIYFFLCRVIELRVSHSRRSRRGACSFACP